MSPRGSELCTAWQPAGSLLLGWGMGARPLRTPGFQPALPRPRPALARGELRCSANLGESAWQGRGLIDSSPQPRAPRGRTERQDSVQLSVPLFPLGSSGELEISK